MSDPVLEAAQALAPLLAAGADGVATEAMRQAGESAAAATRRVLDAVRAALGDGHADEESVAAALRGELDRGALAESDLRQAAQALGAGRDNYGVQAGRNVFNKGSIVTQGDFTGSIDVEGDFKQ